MITKTPYHELPITMVLKSIDRKVYRDQFCLECGHPFFAISDKFIRIYDGAVPIEMLRENERVIEQRCEHTYCKQFYRLDV